MGFKFTPTSGFAVAGDKTSNVLLGIKSCFFSKIK